MSIASSRDFSKKRINIYGSHENSTISTIFSQNASFTVYLSKDKDFKRGVRRCANLLEGVLFVQNINKNDKHLLTISYELYQDYR